MKIVQLVCTYPPYRGGIGNSARTFARLLSRETEFLTLTPKYQTNLKSSSQTKYLRPLVKWGNSAFLPQIFKYLKNKDVILLHYPFFGTDLLVWFYKLTWGKEKKLIIHYHMDVFKLSPVAKILKLPSVLIASSLFRQANLISSFSLDYVKKSKLGSYYQKNKNKFREIPYGINTKKFKPRENKENKSQLNILFVGGLDKAHYFKGLDYLLKALAKSQNQVKLNIVGQGNKKEEFEKKTRQLNIENRVDFQGALSGPELTEIYQKNNLLILPSIDRSEALGIVLLEAMASGLPVIATDLPGVRKVFTPGKEGFIVPVQDEEKLKEKIDYLAKNPEIRKEMGKKARELAEKKYSEKKLENKLKQILEEL